MKTIKSITLVLTIAFATTAISANPDYEKCGDISLDEELTNLLVNPEVTVDKDTIALVKLMANDIGELVVLSVTTVDEAVELYVKDRLNYKKLCNRLDPGESYVLPVMVKKG